MKLYKAYGTCATCNRYGEFIASTPEDAKLLLMHSHDHLWFGDITVVELKDENEKYKARRRRRAS